MNAHFSFSHSLLANMTVQVTKQDINEGASRSFHGCAIALALNRALPSFGFQNCYVRLAPYACFSDARGLEIFGEYGDKPVAYLSSRELPSGLIEWAMEFDDWSEFQDDYSCSKREWKEARGTDYPFRPDPISFVFNLSLLKRP